jgi:hypothetical protein
MSMLNEIERRHFACHALHKSLAKFPWEKSAKHSLARLIAIPFNRLGPLPLGQRLSWRESLMLASLGGVWAFVVANACGMSEASGPHIAGLAAFSAGIGFIRFLVYLSGAYLPPISLRGRLATARIVIPGYDKILLAPLCGFALSIIPSLAFLHWGFSGPACLGITVGLVLAANFGLGPGLNVWRLTGAHRINLTGSIESHDTRAGGSARANAGIY